MEINIRNEETKDIEQVGQVLRAAFPTDAENRLVDALRANGKAIISLVAIQNGQVLGHILFSPVSITPPSRATPPNEAKGIGLAPVAVRPDVHSQGIGSGLIREGLRLCAELGYDYCVVLGDPKYYQRFGFERASQFGVQNEYGADHAFMMIRFSKRSTVQGLIKYAPEFAMFSL
ncbi:MAG: N-acetyltransferase [Chloroflexi bacterium]|nr:MAG: N-acetyltransferase [Chloroflexota bacterium]